MPDHQIILIVICSIIGLISILLIIARWQHNIIMSHQFKHTEQALKLLYDHDDLKIKNSNEYIKICKAKENLEIAEATKYKNNYELLNFILNNKDTLNNLENVNKNDDDDLKWMYDAYKTE